MSGFPKGSFWAMNETNLRNGSCYRITGRKREFAAVYWLGDFHGFISEADMLVINPKVSVTRRDAKNILPPCFS